MSKARQQEVVQAASLKYIRAAQVAADALAAMRMRLQPPGFTAGMDVSAVLAAAAPAIIGEVLSDPDIMEPEEGEE